MQTDDQSSLKVPEIVKTWHFALQAHVESLCSSVAAVLALLLRTISSFIEFRASGNALCNTLLKDDQIKLFDKALSGSRMKDYLISPCLRLLTEIVSFDGGRATGAVFRQRETTLNGLESFLNLRRDVQEGEAESRKKPSVRKLALRYLYANLKLQAPAAKIYILNQGKVVRSLLEDISKDSQEVVLELLAALKNDVALDSALPTHVKSRFFNEWGLSRLATLYSYDEIEVVRPKPHQSVQRSAHDFLIFLCTSPGHGVLDGSEEEIHAVKDDRLVTPHKFISENPQNNVSSRGHQSAGRNAKLSSFLQILRPHANILQSELIIAVFNKVPGLVSDYFTKRKDFSFDPKPTATWIGYSSFMLAVIRMPVSRSLMDLAHNGSLPPSLDEVFDSVLPQVLTQKVLTRCINQSTNLIRFLTANILRATFEKLEVVLHMYRSLHVRRASEPVLRKWNQAAGDLTNEFCCRVPGIENVVTQFQSCPKSCVFLQKALTRLLALYYKLVPHRALDSRLDISAALSTLLQDYSNEASIQHLKLDDMLGIAGSSPSTQWWHKSGRFISHDKCSI